MRDDRMIDEAIDATARTLTDGAPRGALRARVGERIAAPGWWSVVGSRRSVVGGWSIVDSRWSVVAASAAVVIASVALWPEQEVAPARVEAPAPIERLAAPSAPLPPAVEAPVERALSGSPGAPGRVRPTTSPNEPASVRASEANPLGSPGELIAPEPIAVPAVAAIEPIEVEPLEPFEAVELPMIVVEMIDIDPMPLPQ